LYKIILSRNLESCKVHRTTSQIHSAAIDCGGVFDSAELVAGNYDLLGLADMKLHEISDHQQSWGYEEVPSKGPGPRSAGGR